MIDESLLEATEDELLEILGRHLVQDEVPALPLSGKELRRIASDWLQSNSETLRACICTNKQVQELARTGFSADLLVAVLALVESLAFGTAASPLVVLLCRRELGSLCRNEWTETDNETQKCT